MEFVHQISEIFSSLFRSVLTPNIFLERRFSEKELGSILPAVRFEPGSAGWETRTLTLCPLKNASCIHCLMRKLADVTLQFK